MDEFHKNEFQLVVALEVIEHIADYSNFLLGMSKVAKTAIISNQIKIEIIKPLLRIHLSTMSTLENGLLANFIGY